MEVIHMAHAGTMDLDKQRKAKAAPGGSRWLALGLIAVIAVATISGVWFVIGSGLMSGTTTAKPADDGYYDWMERYSVGTTVDDGYYDWMERYSVGTTVDDGYYDWMERYSGATIEPSRGHVGGPR
jgi:hypothetical protein